MKRNTLLKLTISSMATFALIGCGGGGSNGNHGNSNNPTGGNKDPYKIVPVSYKLNGNNPPSCPEASQITILKAQKTNDIGIARCIWLCGAYEGAKPVTVALAFQQNGKDSEWVFDSDVVQTAPDQCHN